MILLAFGLLLNGCGNDRVNRAKELLKLGSVKQAHELLEEHIKDNPKIAEAHFLIGKIHELDKNIQEAFQSFEAAIKIDSGYKETIGRYLWDRLEDGKAMNELAYTSSAFQFYPDHLSKKVDSLIGMWVVDWFPESVMKRVTFFKDGRFELARMGSTGFITDITGTWSVKGGLLEIVYNSGTQQAIWGITKDTKLLVAERGKMHLVVRYVRCPE